MDLSDPPADTGLPPELGVISQTLASSTAVKWILPARIRSPSRSDVVFVGDTSIQLREFVTSGSTHLEDATGKLDFQTQILAAKVLSAQLEPIPTLEAIQNQTGDEERFMIDGIPVREGQPPEILVLSTASSHIIFVYARELYDGSASFVYAKRHLVGNLYPSERLGRHLVVDPQSRAMAVAPASGHFSILSMCLVSEIKQQIDDWRPDEPSSFRPWREQRMAQVDGFVVKMDFLHSPEDDREKVILALLIAKQGEIFLLLYRWDTLSPLHRLKPMRCSGQRLSPSDGFPLMLIPCVSSLSFLLVTETCLVIYDQVTASQANTTRYSFKASDEVKQNGAPPPKKWTQWARPKRHLEHRRMHDDIFLVREDGVIETCLIDFSNRKVKVTTSVTPGKLGINVDSAFCLLAGPLHAGGGDIIIAGGDMADGGLFQARARQPMERVQTIPNATPFQDLLLIDERNKRVSGTPKYINATRMFACCGHSKGHSSVAQVQYGLEAQIAGMAEFPDAASIERIYTLEVRSRQTLLIILSHSTHTSVLTTDVSELELESKDDAALPGFDFDQSTLAAAVLLDDTIVQVTPNSVNVVPVTNSSNSSRLDIEELQPLCAAFLHKSSVIAVLHVTETGYGLSACLIGQQKPDERFSSGIQQLTTFSSRPLCVQQATLEGKSLLLMGTDDGEVRMLDISNGTECKHLLLANIRNFVSELDGVAVTSVCFLSYPQRKRGLILCGLRGGTLVCLEVISELKNGAQIRGTSSLPVMNASSLKVLSAKLSASYSLGSTTATVLPDLYSYSDGVSSSAFALGHSILKYIALKDQVNEMEFDITEVCPTTRNDTSLPQAICSVVHRVPSLQSSSGSSLSGTLICVTPKNLLFSALTSHPQLVLRHVSTPGVPKQLIFSKYLGQLVIAIETSATADSTGWPPDMQAPSLYFISASSDGAENATSTQRGSVGIGERGEGIKALIEFSPSDEHKQFHYEMVVVALTKELREPNGSFKPTSKIVCLSLKHIMKGNWAAAKAKLVASFPGKAVNALCAMGLSSLLIGVGNEIVLQSLDMESKKWTTAARFTLPSAAASICAEVSLVFIACSKHSLLILHYNGSKFSIYASDSSAKRTTNVVAFDKSKAITTSISEKGTSIIGFAEDRLSNGYRKLFDANVPLMIDRIRREPVHDSGGASCASFIGNTSDGTLYRFTSVTLHEWVLLNFIQGLYLGSKDTRRPELRHLIHGNGGGESRSSTPSPSQMHINGDLLITLLKEGHKSLWGLVGMRVKIENEHVGVEEQATRQKLKELADPVVGSHEDTIIAVYIWLRRLLQWPAQ